MKLVLASFSRKCHDDARRALITTYTFSREMYDANTRKSAKEGMYMKGSWYYILFHFARRRADAFSGASWPALPRYLLLLT